MDALEQCHSNNWARLLGQCNRQKEGLNACLRKEVRQQVMPWFPAYAYDQRIERTTENRETAKERKLKAEQARKKFYDDE
jgi:COX assembly protein 2